MDSQDSYNGGLSTVSDSPRKLSQNGQMVAIGVYCGLLVVGFFFGVVTGYEAPKVVTIARKDKERENPAPSIRPDSGRDSTKGGAKGGTSTTSTDATPSPKTDPAGVGKKDDPSAGEPKKDPGGMAGMGTTTPPAGEPKKDPGGTATTPPKVEPKKVEPPKSEPKTEVLTPVSFKDEVLPILRTHCLNCHGAGTGKPKGEVDLTTVAKMMKSRGKVLVPGKPNESDIYTSITERDMPDGGRPKPSQKELTVLRNWILAGGKERRRKGHPTPR